VLSVESSYSDQNPNANKVIEKASDSEMIPEVSKSSAGHSLARLSNKRGGSKESFNRERLIRDPISFKDKELKINNRGSIVPTTQTPKKL